MPRAFSQVGLLRRYLPAGLFHSYRADRKLPCACRWYIMGRTLLLLPRANRRFVDQRASAGSCFKCRPTPSGLRVCSQVCSHCGQVVPGRSPPYASRPPLPYHLRRCLLEYPSWQPLCEIGVVGGYLWFSHSHASRCPSWVTVSSSVSGRCRPTKCISASTEKEGKIFDFLGPPKKGGVVIYRSVGNGGSCFDYLTSEKLYDKLASEPDAEVTARYEITRDFGRVRGYNVLSVDGVDVQRENGGGGSGSDGGGASPKCF